LIFQERRMGSEQTVLPVVAVPGLRLDSLGNYLASLGLLRVLVRSGWPSVRAAWNNGTFQIVGGPKCLDNILEEVCKIATSWAWTPYERSWSEAQKQSTKKKSGALLALWQASAPEQDLEFLCAHAVPAARVSFNPLLGSGGNAGKRDFSDGWSRAVQALASDQNGKDGVPDAVVKRAELKALLLGDSLTWMIEKLNAACWFSDTNKLYNSGQRPFREGAASPWAMALACEGLPFFVGGPSRRLGSRARAVGAFPFVTGPSAPGSSGEAGRDLGEVWAPIWERPMSLPEVVTLFQRGRAELGGRGVITPSAFAAAVMRRGVDAGITEFRRFVLGHTTSSNTFEPRFGGVFHVAVSAQPAASILQREQRAAAAVMERVVALVDQFVGPLKDRKVGKRWRYVGLRGGVEAAALRAAESPIDSEAALNLADSVLAALDRIDRNRAFREQVVAWEPLPLDWLSVLFGNEPPSAEARLGLALVSSFPMDRPFAVYRFGVAPRGHRFVHPPQVPRQWVWRSTAPVSRVLAEVLYRRTLDWESEREAGEPVRSVAPASSAHVANWLSCSLDDNLLSRWISRLALFDWQTVPWRVRALGLDRSASITPAADLCLFGLLQPLFDLRPVMRAGEPRSDLLPQESGARTPAAARRLLGLLRIGDTSGAVRFAASRYQMACAPLVKTAVPWNVDEPERLAASLLFQISDHERSALVGRWLRPQRAKEGQVL
jgi:CRISPR-associated protein Csx17